MLDYLNPGTSDTVLDVECGPGTQLIDMAPSIKPGFGFDLSEEMIEMAKNRATEHENLKFFVSSTESFPDEMYDKNPR